MKQCFAAVCFAMLIPLVVGAQTKRVEKVERKGDQIVIPYEKYVLSNGLTLIVHEDHSDPVVQVDVTYHVGSAREEIGKSGFAHFFEHMMFQGSDHVGDEEHFKIVTESGGTLNGSTNRDRTNYYQTVPVNQLEKMLWLEADRMGFLLDAVTQQKFEVQRATVKNERGQNYDNRPYGLLGEVTAKNLYPYGHPYSWLTIGYIEDLDRVNVNDLKNFFLRWYGPNNATVTVGGDVNPSEVVKLVEKYFGSMPKGPEVKKMDLPAPVLKDNRYVTLTDNYARLPLLSITYPTVPNYHKDMAALACLAQVIGQGKNSALYQHLEKKQKATSAQAYSVLSELSGEFSVRILPANGVTLQESFKLYRAALDSFETRGVSEEDIQKFKGGFEAQTLNGLQSVAGKVFQLASFETLAGDANMIAKIIAMYNAVTREDVMRVYRQYIKDKGAVVVSVVPKGQEANIVAAENHKITKAGYKAPSYGYEGLKYVKAKDSFDRSKRPGSSANPVVPVPAFWKADLPGGIKVIGSESRELPLVTFSLTLPGGHLMQASDTSKAGLSNLLARMLGEDTQHYTAEQMQAALQKLGSTINVSSTRDGIVFSVQSLKRNLDKTVALLEERILRPRFTQEAFSRIQKQLLEGFKVRKSQPESVADDVFEKLNFGETNILGINESGTEHSVRSLTLKEVENYYSKTLSSRNAKVVVVGDVSRKDFLSTMAFTAKIPDVELPAYTLTPPVAAKPGKIFLVNVPKAAQTQFRIGKVTGLKYDATGEFYRAGLMNYALGGAFNSRLNLNLREDKGWTYGARSYFDGDEYAGTFAFNAGIKATATDSAFAEVMKELKNYSTAGISDSEISFMKSAISQRDALRYETPFQKASFLERILDYNLSDDFTKTQADILAKMTKEEISALAKKWATPESMNILLVGDKQLILPGLQKFGYEIIELDVNGKVKGLILPAKE